MRTQSAVLTAFAGLVSLHLANAYFIVGGDVIVHERIDPVVNPGELSSHTHTIIGPNNIGPDSTYETLQTATCTSSSVTKDLSAYWQPTLYYYNPADKSYTVIPSYARIYYLNRPGPKNQPLVAFPPGFRMVAGSPKRSTYDPSSFAHKAVDFVCLGVDGPGTPEFPKQNCPGGIRAQVVFPTCWNGNDLYLPDNSHVAYPIQNVDGGDCPDSHPVHFMTLFQEFIYETQKFPFNDGDSTWVLATGDATGYSLHADFLNGWDIEVLQHAIDQCTSDIGNSLENCPPLAPYFDPEAGKACRMAANVVEEDVGLTNPIAKLPGCNPLYTTGERPGTPCPDEGTPPGFVAPSSARQRRSIISTGRRPMTIR